MSEQFGPPVGVYEKSLMGEMKYHKLSKRDVFVLYNKYDRPRDGTVYEVEVAKTGAILKLFEIIFNIGYDNENKIHKIAMQNMVYMLELLGQDVCSYPFEWDSGKNCMFSAVLEKSVQEYIENENEEASIFGQNRIEDFGHIFAQGKGVSVSQAEWLKLLCNVHYTSDYMSFSNPKEMFKHISSTNKYSQKVIEKAWEVVDYMNWNGYYDPNVPKL